MPPHSLPKPNTGHARTHTHAPCAILRRPTDWHRPHAQLRRTLEPPGKTLMPPRSLPETRATRTHTTHTHARTRTHTWPVRHLGRPDGLYQPHTRHGSQHWNKPRDEQLMPPHSLRMWTHTHTHARTHVMLRHLRHVRRTIGIDRACGFTKRRPPGDETLPPFVPKSNTDTHAHVHAFKIRRDWRRIHRGSQAYWTTGMKR
jgi:hypothetical protein